MEAHLGPYGNILSKIFKLGHKTLYTMIYAYWPDMEIERVTDFVIGADDSWCCRLSLYCNSNENIQLLFQYKK